MLQAENFAKEFEQSGLLPDVFKYYLVKYREVDKLDLKVAWFNIIMDYHLAFYHTKTWQENPSPKNGKESKKLEALCDAEVLKEFERFKTLLFKDVGEFKLAETWSVLFLKIDKD